MGMNKDNNNKNAYPSPRTEPHQSGQVSFTGAPPTTILPERLLGEAAPAVRGLSLRLAA